MTPFLDNATLDYLYSLHRRGIKIGLHRTEALLKRCGNPHRELPVIHIAGTNGKGTTAAMIASILKSSGRKVGLYTSPHLVRFNERIRVNGAPVSDDWIVSFLNTHRETVDALDSTFFETTTAMMFAYFAERAVDVAVVEVGMGGRLDSSNVAESVVSVLTPIDFDHMEFLGHDLASITKEKCGIFRKGVPVVTAPQRDEAVAVIRLSAQQTQCPVSLSAETHPVSGVSDDANGMCFSINGHQLELPLIGRHQVVNAQTAVAAAATFDSKINENTISAGLRAVSWPGRLQRLAEDPPAYYDVGHNAHGVEAATLSLRELFPDARFGAVCALKRKKDLDRIMPILCNNFEEVVTVQPRHGDFHDPVSLAAILKESGVPVEASASLAQGLKQCKSTHEKVNVWLIFGTHYIAEEVFDLFDFPFDKGDI